MSRQRAVLIAAGLLALGVVWFRSNPVLRRATDAGQRPTPAVWTGADVATGEPRPPDSRTSQGPTLSADAVSSARLKRIDAFTDWLGAWRRGGPGQRDAIVARGVELARARRGALRELIAIDPAGALDRAVPRSLRAELPAAVIALLEEPVDASGALQVLAVCAERGAVVERTAVVADRRYDVFTYGRRLESLSKERVPLHGIAIEGRLALAEQPCRRLEDPELAANELADGTIAVAMGEQITTFSSPAALSNWIDSTLAAEAAAGPATAAPVSAAATGSSWAWGEKTVLWVRVEFSDDPGTPATDEAIAAAMTQVNAYYDAVSRGRTSFKATVLPGTLLSSKGKAELTEHDSATLYNEIKRLAKNYDTANGGTGRYDPDRYDRWILVFKSVPAFNWGGLGWIGASGLWLNGGANADTAIHELGHNQGLYHSHAWKPSTASPISPGEHVEYGDYFDEMGGNGHFNTRQKLNLQYLEAAETQTATASAIYRIYRHDHRQASGVQAVVVDAGMAYDYWLEYRCAAPNSYFHYLEQLRGGITLRWGKRPAFTSGEGTYLLDMTPLSVDGMADAPLVLGESFTDPNYGITLVPVETGGAEPNQWIDVRVSFGATGTNHDPVVQDLTHDLPVQARTDVAFTASGSDPDGDTVYYRWDFGDARTSPTTATVRHRWLVGGDYEVKVRAVDGKGGVATRAVNVTVADPLLNWTRRAEGLTLNALDDVVWTGREFVAVGADVVLSSDGVTWGKAMSVPFNTYLHGVTVGNESYVAVGMTWDNGAWAGAALVSKDGLSWQRASLPAGAGPLTKVAFGGGRFVAVAETGKAYGSTDGATWTESSTGVTESLRAIRHADGLFVAAGDKGTIVTSLDGLSWSNHTPALATGSFRGIARLGGVWYVSAGYDMWSSVDAATWERASWNGGWSINSLEVAFGVMLGARGGGGLYVSTGNDARAEITPEPGQTRTYNATAEGNGTIVLVGEQGVILQAGVPSLVAPQFAEPAELAGADAGRPVAVAVASSGYTKLELLVDGAVVQEISGAASTFSWTPPSFGSHRVSVRGTKANGASMTSKSVLVQAGLGNWDWVNPRPFGGPLNGAVEVDGQWWLVGGRDTLLVLDREGKISESELGFANSPKAIAHGQGRFVVVGNSYDGVSGGPTSAMLTSTDGVRWTAVPRNGRDASFSRVVFNRATGIWAATSEKDVWRSSDGLTWTRYETGASGWLSSLACDGGRWVAVGSSGSIVTSADAITWVARNVGTESLIDVATAGGKWVVVGGNGAILSSTDGVNWTPRSSGTTSWFEGVAAVGSRFVAMDYGEIFSSADGTSWSKVDGNYWDISCNGLAAAADGAIAFGSNGRILRSTDGLAWTRPSQGPARTYEDVIYAGGKYVAVCDSYDSSTNQTGPTVETSRDGRTWSPAVCDAYHLGDVTYGAGRYVAVGRAGIYTSTDAQRWTRCSSDVAEELRTVATGPTSHVAAGAGGCIMTSPDGSSWTKVASPVNSRWCGAAYGRPGFVLVGEAGTIATSVDGATWKARTSGVTVRLNAIAWREGVGYVAVGEQGTLLVSGDGVSWARRDTGTTTEMIDVTASALGLAVVGSYGDEIWITSDGSAWAARRLPASLQLRSIVASPQGWVIAGYNGIMLWHAPTETVSSGPLFARQPASQASAVGSTIALSAALAAGSTGGLQWQRNGVDLASATAETLTVADVQPDRAGLYAVVAAGAEASATSAPAIVGVSSSAKVIGAGRELQPVNIRHPNGNTFDQVLLTGIAESITADHTQNQITRTSFIDLDGDIVQVEFAGPGTLSLVLDQASGPAEPVNYHQPGVTYMKGHAGIIITGADENTHLSVFTVGRATANDPTGVYSILRAPDPATNDPARNGSPLFAGHEATVYDGIADLAFVAISSTNGRFGGVRTANANYFAARGFTGIYAPGIAFSGPVFVGDIAAFDSARPVLMLGAATDVRVTGGNMEQPNGQPVQVSGVAQLKFAPGSDSHGHTFAARPNRGLYQQNGSDVTARIVVNP